MWAPVETYEANLEAQRSYLDEDDISAPGTSTYDKRTGDPAIDFSLFTISKYALSEDKQERKLFASCFPRTISSLKSTSNDYFLGLVESMLEDDSEVAEELLDKLPLAVEHWILTPGAYQSLTTWLFPLLGRLLCDSNETLAKKAADSYGKLILTLKPDDMGSVALTQLLLIAHDDDREQSKIHAIRLLNESAPVLGRGLSEQFLASEVIALADHDSELVRKTVAGSMLGVFRTVKPPVVQSKLIPVLERLSKDSRIAVRRVVVEVLPELAQGITNPESIITVYQQLLKDKNKAIKQLTALKAGALAVAFAGRSRLPETVIMAYMEQATGGQNEENALICAQYLPAMVVAMGAGRWNEISKAFHALATSTHKPVRRMVAASLHEIAKVVGKTITDKDLVPIYAAMTGKSEMEEVKYVALTHFAEFLMRVSGEKRTGFSELISWMSMPRPNWRFRELLSTQLHLLSLLFDIYTVRFELWPSSLRLLTDPAAAVHIPAAYGLGAVTARLLRDTDDMKDEIKALTEEYAYSQSCTKRKLFLYMAKGALTDLDTFKDHYQTPFLHLAIDKIPSIRLISTEIALLFPDFFSYLLEEMKKDDDSEVRFTANRSEMEGKWLVSCLIPLPYSLPYSESVSFQGNNRAEGVGADLMVDGTGFPMW